MDNNTTPEENTVATEEAVNEVKVEKPIDNHTVKDTMEFTSEVKDISDVFESLSSTAKHSFLLKYLKQVSAMTTEEFDAVYNTQDILSLNINSTSQRFTNTNDILTNAIKEGDFVNDVNYGDNALSARNVNVKAKGTVTGAAALASFNSIIGVGTTAQIPLWHSGFWVAIKPPTNQALLNLELALAENEIELGRNTNTLIYSNYSVVFTRLVVDFILEHLVSTSITLSPNDDIRDYILQQDLYPLVLVLIKAIYPTGYETTITCNNTLEVDEDLKPKCNFVANAKIAPELLLWVNRKHLTDKALEHMSKRGSNAVSINAVKEYQNLMGVNKAKEYKIKHHEDEIVITFKMPTLKDYIDNGELWVENLISGIEDTFTSETSVKDKNKSINKVLMVIVLGIYNVFVDSVKINNGIVSRDSDGLQMITSALETLSGDDEILSKFIDYVKEFIDSTTMAVVGSPNYTCPECSTLQEDKSLEIIPMNILESFFVLSALKIQNLNARSI